MPAEDPIDALLAAVGHAPDDALAGPAAQARSRRQWLRQQAGASSTMAGVLLTLAERVAPVTLHCGPWIHTGRLRSVTAALAIAEVPEGTVLLPTASITAVEATTLVADDRPLGGGPDLAAALAWLTSERPVVRLLLGDGSELAGMLLEVGNDVAALRCTSSVASVRLSALAGCVLLARGNNGPA